MRSYLVLFIVVSTAMAFRPGRLQFFNSFSMMCASDECVPAEIKNDIKAGWTSTGKQVWDACVPAETPCTQENRRDMSRCVFGRLTNITDITVKEARETWEKFSMKGMEDCCEDKITVGMVQCAVKDARRRRPYRPSGRTPVENPDSERVDPANNRT